MRKHSLIPLSLLFLPLFNQAATVVEVYPITDRIVCVQYSEGYIDRSGNNDVAVINALDTDAATQTANYALDEQGQSSPVQPTRIYRKARAVDIGRIWPSYDWVLNHWVYLEFAQPLVNGVTYEITLNGMATNGDVFTFTVGETRSESIRVNQVGMNSASPRKYGYLYQWMGEGGSADLSGIEGNNFHLREVESGEIAYTGTVGFRANQSKETGQANENDIGYYGADIWQCDFSDFSPTDNLEYWLEVEGLGRSFPFIVGPDGMRDAFLAVMRGLFHHRSGPARDLPHSDVPKPADHMPSLGQITVYRSAAKSTQLSQNQLFTELPAQADYSTTYPNAWGGHFDAGDWDRNANHLNIPQFALEVYELKPENFGDSLGNIPDSGNGIPDIVDEARWSVDFFRRIMLDGGGIPGHLETSAHPLSGTTSWTEGLTDWFLSAPEPVYSYHFAAVSAHLAFLAQRDGFLNQIEINGYRQAALDAWNWAENNVEQSALNLNTASVSDYRALAAAQLFKLTEDTDFQDAFLESAPINSSEYDLDANDRNLAEAAGAFATIKHDAVDPNLLSNVKASLKTWVNDEYVIIAQNRACRMAFTWFAPTIVGLTSTTPTCMPLVYAYGASDTQAERDLYYGYIATTADYFLGGNPLNKVWVTRLGDRPVWAVLNVDQNNDDSDNTVPGIIPYGFQANNFHNTPDPATRFNGEGGYNANVNNSIFWGGAGYGKLSCYPNDVPGDPGAEGYASNWPIHELHFENTYVPIIAEYTIHQNMSYGMAIYGFLAGPAPDDIVAEPEITQVEDTRMLYYPLYTTEYTSLSTSSDLINWTQQVDLNARGAAYGRAWQLEYPLDANPLFLLQGKASAE